MNNPLYLFLATLWSGPFLFKALFLIFVAFGAINLTTIFMKTALLKKQKKD